MIYEKEGELMEFILGVFVGIFLISFCRAGKGDD